MGPRHLCRRQAAPATAQTGGEFTPDTLQGSQDLIIGQIRYKGHGAIPARGDSEGAGNGGGGHDGDGEEERLGEGPPAIPAVDGAVVLVVLSRPHNKRDQGSQV